MDGECKREWTSLSYIQPISHLQKPINWPAMIEAISLMYSNPGCPAVAVGLALPTIITENGLFEKDVTSSVSAERWRREYNCAV